MTLTLVCCSSAAQLRVSASSAALEALYKPSPAKPMRAASVRDVDDEAAVAQQHAADDGLRQPERTEHVGAQHILERARRRVGELRRRSRSEVRRVVDEDIDAAETLERRRGESLDVARVGDVREHGDHLGTLLAALLRNSLERLSRHVRTARARRLRAPRPARATRPSPRDAPVIMTAWPVRVAMRSILRVFIAERISRTGPHGHPPFGGCVSPRGLRGSRAPRPGFGPRHRAWRAPGSRASSPSSPRYRGAGRSACWQALRPSGAGHRAHAQ